MSYVLRNKQNIFFSFLACKTLRVIVRLFFSIFSSSTIFWWLMYLLPFIFIYKKDVFLFLNYLMWLLVFSKHSYSLLLMGFIVVFFCFLSDQENLYMIYKFKTYFMHLWQMNAIKCEITTAHWCFQSNLISRMKCLKKFFNNFFWFMINYDFGFLTALHGHHYL